MIAAFLSTRAFRLVVLAYALCLLYLTLAPLAVIVLVALLLFRASIWVAARIDASPPGDDPPGGQRVHPRSPSGRW